MENSYIIGYNLKSVIDLIIYAYIIATIMLLGITYPYLKALKQNKTVMKTRVFYNNHLHQYEVEYRKCFIWHYDSCYKYDPDPEYPINYTKKEEALERAIKRAEAMTKNEIVWRS